MTTEIQAYDCKTAADVMAHAAAVRARRKAVFFVPQAPRITPRAQQIEPAKPVDVPSLTERFIASFAADPILKATAVNGAIIAKEAALSSAYTIDGIQRAMCLLSGCRKDDMVGPRRMRHIVEPRQIAMFLAKHFTNRSLPEIGRRFGGRDHTTVLCAVRKFEWMESRLPGHGATITEIAEAAWTLYQERRTEKAAA